MARKFLTAVDMAKNELQNAAVQNLAADPSTPVKGQAYFNTGSNKLRTYNGSTWDEYGTGAGAGSVTSVSVVSTNGFAGTVATATSTPAITLTTTATGLLKGNGTAISAAAAGTDYQAAITATGVLKGAGSGSVSGSATLTDLGTPTADFSMGSHKLTSVTDPASAQDAATKNYVDATVQGLQPKPTATVVATSALPAGTYSNGTSGVGATFTVTATGTTTVDSYVLATGDLILLTAQASALQNGLYTVTTAGTTGVATVLTRHIDMDAPSEFKGAFIPVGNAGTINANSLWIANPSGTVTVGTTAIPFTEMNKAADLVAGTGLAISGNTVSIENTGVLTVAHGGTGAATLTGLVKGNGTGAFTAAASGTDYAPATSGSSILKGNGSGGFSSAKFTATIGDGSTTAIAVTHSLGTQDVIAQVRDATTNAVVDCDITQTSTTVTTFGFITAPASGAYKVVIIG